MEEDLSAIMKGEPNLHKGRFERGTLIARGTYNYTRGGKDAGTERWELMRMDGGRLVHSEISAANSTTSVWYQTDANNRPSFVEVTKRQNNNLTRARYYIDGRRLSVQMRGSESGALEQTTMLPESAMVLSPAIATLDWRSIEPSGLSNQERISDYAISGEYLEALELIRAARYIDTGMETVRVPAGVFQSRRLKRTTEKETSDWWWHQTFGIVVKGRVRGGLEYVLTSFEPTPTGKQ